MPPLVRRHISRLHTEFYTVTHGPSCFDFARLGREGKKTDLKKWRMGMPENYSDVSRINGIAGHARVSVPVLALILAAQSSFAAPATKTGGVLAVSAGTALSGLGVTPVGAFVGGFQIGWGIGCVLFDPPDVANAGVPVNINDLLLYQLPDVLSLDPALPANVAGAINGQADMMDAYVAHVRAYISSLDREAGAELLGRPDWAAERAAEAGVFRSQALGIGAQAAAAYPSLLAALESYAPGALAQQVTLDDILALRDEIGAGIFPAFEQMVFDSWAISSFERSALISRLGGLSDSAVAAMFSQLNPSGGAAPAGNALLYGTELCAECLQTVPEPAGAALMAAGGLALFAVRRWRGRGISAACKG
jgi:hypothetical protein